MPRAKGKTLLDGFSRPQSVNGVTRQVAHGVYQAMTGLHQRGFAHNDLKPDNTIYDVITGDVTLIDSGAVEKFSKSQPEFRQSAQAIGTHGYMSPRVINRQAHGPETDYYAFACTLLATTEPDFAPTLLQIFAQEYPQHMDERRQEGVQAREILRNQPPASYPWIMIEEGKRDLNTMEAALRLEEKLNNHPEFRAAVVDSFIVSTGQEPAAGAARQRLTANPYLQSQN